MRVLIIDDNVLQADTMADYLNRHGYEADWAPCAVGAVGRMKLKNYDVALVDLILPCCSPEELVSTVLRQRNAPRLIALTGLVPGDPTLSVLPPGTPVLHKPVDPEEILRMIESTVAAVY
jgi:two-component system copper resistance phosphate regulon response regulator CusR